MHILVNAVGARIGGAARHLPAFLDAFTHVEPEWRIHVAVSAGERWLVDGLPVHGVKEVPVSRLRGRPWWDLEALCGHARALGANGILNLTNHGPLRRCGPSIVYQRNPIYFDPTWVRGLPRRDQWKAAARRRLAFRQMAVADVVVTPSAAMAGFLRAWPRTPRACQYAVVPHAVDAQRFSYTPRPLRSLDNVRLAVVSHAAPHKGIDTAIHATAELVRMGHSPTLTLTIPRHGHTGIFREYVERCAAIAHDGGIDDRVLFSGPINDVEDLYRTADVIVVPSLTESFGFPLLEAMASGTPLLASNIPSSMEVAGDAAWYFSSGDPKGAVEALVAMAGSPIEDAKRRLALGRRRSEGFTWERNARTVASLVRASVVRAAR